MFSVPRSLIVPIYPRLYLTLQYTTTKATTYSILNSNNQMDYIKSAFENTITSWSDFKTNILNRKGSINPKNFDGVLLKHMISSQKFKEALSYAEYIEKTTEELSLGTINGLLGLYYEIGRQRPLSDTEKSFILESYSKLYDKYKVLDYTTCERLLHALCVINEDKKCFKVLEDIHVTTTPSHSAYSCLIATLFNMNKKSEAMALILRSLNNRRPLTDTAYEAWIDYINRKYKHKKTKLKHFDEIFCHIANNFVTLTEHMAKKLKDTYTSLSYKADFTTIKKNSGQCTTCKDSLECLQLTDDEFILLQKNVRDKLIVGSDLFLKSSPEELKKFTEFLERTAPYDIVLDALNIALAVGRFQHNVNKVNLLSYVVHHFREQNKKVLLLGRKHMLNWPKKPMQYIMSNTSNFFIDNLSQDDPYFITAAIMSGPQADIVSKDLLRGHRFLLKDERLRLLFLKWQWQHQWMVFMTKKGGPVIQPPMKFTPCAQKKDNAWHLPYQREGLDTTGQVHTGMPDWSSWLCVRPDAA